jgi:hypothetical protein
VSSDQSSFSGDNDRRGLFMRRTTRTILLHDVAEGMNISAHLPADERRWVRHVHDGREMATEELLLQRTTATGKRRSQVAGFDHHLIKPVGAAAIEKLLAELEARSA